MALSTELISQFAKVIVKDEPRPESITVVGTAKLYDGKIYVQIDGSNGQLTPIASSTVGMKDGDRVTVQIKNHSATVTGNATDPSAGKSYADEIDGKVDNVSDQISEFEIIIADKVDVDQINAVNGRIDNLVSENVTITGKLDAVEANIGDLTADNVTINEKLTAAEADIDHLESSKADITVLESEYATIENLNATNATINNLEATYTKFEQTTTNRLEANEAEIAKLDAEKLSATDADIKYANIDFTNIGVAAVEELFAKSGIIEDLVVSGGHITGELVGVTIKGDLIEGNTIKADKLVVLGSDGLYYKLNVNAETVAAEQTDYNSLNGSIITANTITAEKINVDDLVAFNATIGGYHISDGSLYSGAKNSATNTTRGVYLGDDGQFAVGDSNNYLKFYNDNGTWKLEISANTIKMGAKSVEEYVDEKIDGVEVGGRNLLLGSRVFSGWNIKNAQVSFISDRECLRAVLSKSGEMILSGKVGEFGLNEIMRAKTITVSYEYRVEGTPVAGMTNAYVGVQITVRYSSESNSYFGLNFGNDISSVTKNMWLQYSKTITVKDDVVTSVTFECFCRDVTGGTFHIRKPKIEIGNVATTWSVAPEDVYSGSRNLLTYTNQGETYWWWSTQTGITTKTTYTDENGTDCVELSRAADADPGSWSVITYTFENYKMLKPGSAYVLSFDVYSTVADNNNLSAQIFSANGTYKFTTTANATTTSLPARQWTTLIFYLRVRTEVEGYPDYDDIEQSGSNITVYLTSLPTSADVTYRFRNIKLEEGDTPSAWTPAPEDVDQSIRTARDQIITETQAYSENLNDSLTDYVGKTFYTKEEGSDLKTEVGEISTKLTQTENQFEMNFTNVSNRLANLSESTADQFDNINKYIRFLNGDIILGEEGNATTLKIENDRIAFLDSNNEVMYITDQELYIMKAIIATQLTIGKFSWVPRSNGNVSFRYIG